MVPLVVPVEEVVVDDEEEEEEGVEERRGLDHIEEDSQVESRLVGVS